MGRSSLRLLFGFDALDAPTRGQRLGPTDQEQTAPRVQNLDGERATAPLLTEHLVANRRRLGLELRLVSTERAAATGEPWLYELAIHNRDAVERYLCSPGGLWTMLPEVVRAGLTAGAARLLVTNLIEGTSLPLLGRLYEYLASVGVAAERVGYFCGTSNLGSLHAGLCSERDIGRRLSVAGVPFWEERTYADFLLARGSYPLDDARRLDVAGYAQAAFTREPRPSAFLCLNGKGRHHRWALASLLLQRGLLEQGIVSFLSREPEDTVWWPEGALGAEARAGAALLGERLPIEADEAMGRASEGPWFSSHLYLRSTFSVVAETLYTEEPAAFLSEKTFRPILHLHPFVILGPPGMLRALRASGYETFSPLVDESYDELADPTARLAAVVDEVARIVAMTPSERVDWLLGLRGRLEHNLCRLLSQRFHEPDELDHELCAALGALVGARGAHAEPPGRPAPMRLADLPGAWLTPSPPPAPVRADALWVASHLWRWPPSAFARLGLRPVRASVTPSAIEVELAWEQATTVVHLEPSERCTRAYCRSGSIAIFYSGALPFPSFPRLLDRLASRLAGLDFDAVRALCERPVPSDP